jgi:hypothetical protein
MHGKHVKKNTPRQRSVFSEIGAAHVKEICYGVLALPLAVGAIGVVGAAIHGNKALDAHTAAQKETQHRDDLHDCVLMLGFVVAGIGYAATYKAIKTSASGSGYNESFPVAQVTTTEAEPTLLAVAPLDE